MQVSHPRHFRILNRCVEIANEPGAPPAVTHVYASVLKEPLETYLATSEAFVVKSDAWRKENGEALKALENFVGTFETGRSALAAMHPDETLPDPLKSAPTDTDKGSAIEGLLHSVEKHKPEPWAEALLSGEFGTKAPLVVAEIDQAVQASKDLTAACDARAAAFGQSYEKFLAFKRVVRSAFGPTSKQYHRIHVHTRAEADDAQPVDAAIPALPATPL